MKVKEEGKTILVFAETKGQYNDWFRRVGSHLENVRVLCIQSGTQLRRLRPARDTYIVVLGSGNKALDVIRRKPEYSNRYLNVATLERRVRRAITLGAAADNAFKWFAANGYPVANARAAVA